MLVLLFQSVLCKIHVLFLFSLSNNRYLLYKHQWNTRWALAGKHDIFTHMKRSLLLWLHNKLCLSQWNWNALVYHECLYNTQNITWPLGDTEFLFSCWKIFHSFAVLTHEIFSALEEKFRISAPPCNIVYVCLRQTILANFTP